MTKSTVNVIKQQITQDVISVVSNAELNWTSCHPADTEYQHGATKKLLISKFNSQLVALGNAHNYTWFSPAFPHVLNASSVELKKGDYTI